jgi:acyl-coenzyme A thioesterase PaaI-like protein
MFRRNPPLSAKKMDKGSHLMFQKSFQDDYPDVFAYCYGCGRLNEQGHQIKSYWDGAESVCHFLPKPYHIAIPGYVYGGLLASLIDCHGTGTAAGAVSRSAKEQGEEIEANPRFLTASLHVDYLKPTPLGVELEVRGKVKEHKGRKVVIEEWILANGIITVRGEVIAVQVPESMVDELVKGKQE